MNQKLEETFVTYSAEIWNRLNYESSERNAEEAVDILKDALTALSNSDKPNLNPTYAEWINRLFSDIEGSNITEAPTYITLKFSRPLSTLEDLNFEITYHSDSPNIIKIASYKEKFIKRQEYTEGRSLIISNIYAIDYEEFRGRVFRCILYLIAKGNQEL